MGCLKFPRSLLYMGCFRQLCWRLFFHLGASQVFLDICHRPKRLPTRPGTLKGSLVSRGCFFLISGKSRLVKYDYHMARLVYLPRFSWFVWQLSTLRISNQLPRCIYIYIYIYLHIHIYIYCMYRYILCWCAKCISKTFFSPPIWRPPQVCKSPQLWSKSL